ncbi:MAG: hypothetical protein KME07_04910 [Pegethrix bostrychoides GSE-TBD4-15B]|jgi:hypothetical protein|uniref:Uncharacterized protein n=1 Tax=Pegethrix bostrychoides GSE-TBD4-15B TaxID=2839662 RepID=A0A951P7Y4_9CYAN|nr:hypothetical protein [Pegethrix bostrychoides GSE-TBD4-15B]
MFSFNPDHGTTAQRLYCELEQLPPSAISNPSSFNFGLGFAWKLLLQALVEELVEEQQVEYLERCLTADADATNGLKRFLTLIA